MLSLVNFTSLVKIYVFGYHILCNTSTIGYYKSHNTLSCKIMLVMIHCSEMAWFF